MQFFMLLRVEIKSTSYKDINLIALLTKLSQYILASFAFC